MTTPVKFNGRQSGKSHAIALKVAEQMRAGMTCWTTSTDPETGMLRFEKIVGVPGFSDGGQLTHRSEEKEG